MRNRNILLALTLALPALTTGVARAYEIDRKTNSIKLTSLADFDRCSTELGAENCFDALTDYVAKNPSQAFAAGKKARLNLNSATALPLFARALSKQPSAAQCTDEDVGLAVLAGVALPPSDPRLATALKLAESCWAQLQPKLTAELKEPGGYFHDNACPLFATKGVTATECLPAPKPAPASNAPSETAAKLKALDWTKLKTDPESTARFLSPERGEVLMVQAGAPQDNLYLVKFKGIRGPWNNKVLLTREQPGGNGKNYIALVAGAEWTVMTERSGSYEAYPKEHSSSMTLYPALPAERAKPLSSGEILHEFSPAPRKP